MKGVQEGNGSASYLRTVHMLRVAVAYAESPIINSLIVILDTINFSRSLLSHSKP